MSKATFIHRVLAYGLLLALALPAAASAADNAYVRRVLVVNRAVDASVRRAQR